jgi:hypothetical protein
MFRNILRTNQAKVSCKNLHDSKENTDSASAGYFQRFAVCIRSLLPVIRVLLYVSWDTKLRPYSA